MTKRYKKKDQKLKPGEPIEPCTEAPAVRVRDSEKTFKPRPGSVGYTSRGHVHHFLPDREVNLAKLNKALVDVFGEPALRTLKMELVIDQEYWEQVCGDGWSGNVYKYSF